MIDVKSITKMVVAGCIVHNLCERNRDYYSTRWECSWTDNTEWSGFYELADHNDASVVRNTCQTLKWQKTFKMHR